MPIKVDRSQLAHELGEIQQKWQRAANRISDLQPAPVGASPRELVQQWDGVCLYRYTGTLRPTNRVPLLVVYSLVNRPSILDLKPERSLIGALRDSGAEVHLLDWGYPDPSDRFLNLDDYINGYIEDAIEFLCRQYEVDQVHLLGVCQGGTLSACYAALHPHRVRSLITLVTPIDFHAGASTLHHLAKHVDFDRLVDTGGNVSADLLNTVFVGLKPYRLLSQRYLEMLEIAEDDQALEDFLRMEQWMYDSPNQAGEAFRQFAKEFYQDNGLVRGRVCLGNRYVELKNINMPVFNVYASGDHLVPPESALALGNHIRSRNYHVQEFPAGHLGVFISGRAKKSLYPAIGQWLKQWDVLDDVP